MHSQTYLFMTTSIQNLSKSEHLPFAKLEMMQDPFGLLNNLEVIQFACLDGLLHASAELRRGEARRLEKVRILMDQWEGQGREPWLMSLVRTIS